MKVSEARNMDRDVVESGLTFAGFAVSNYVFNLFALFIFLFYGLLFSFFFSI